MAVRSARYRVLRRGPDAMLTVALVVVAWLAVSLIVSVGIGAAIARGAWE